MNILIELLKFCLFFGVTEEGSGGDADSGKTDDGGSADSDAGDDGASGEAAQPPEEPKGAWPDDWRDRLSKGDEKLLKQFGRYQSPEAVGEALIAAQRKIRSGDLVPKLSDKADEKEIAEYRKQMGIPDKVSGYDLKLESGRVVGEEDKPFVDEFLAKAHASNMTPGQVQATIDYYLENREKQAQARIDLDEEQRISTLNELEEEWGPQTKGYKNRIANLLTKIPEASREALMNARLPDGTAVFNNADILRGLLAIDLELDPAGTVIAGGGDPMRGVDEEMAGIEKVIRTKRSEYDKDEKMQARYRELIEIKMKLEERAKAS